MKFDKILSKNPNSKQLVQMFTERGPQSHVTEETKESSNEKSSEARVETLNAEEAVAEQKLSPAKPKAKEMQKPKARPQAEPTEFKELPVISF